MEKKKKTREDKKKCQQRQSREGASSQPGSHPAIPCPHVDILFRMRSTIFAFTSPRDQNHRHLRLRKENFTIIVPIWTKYIISASRKYNLDVAALDLWDGLVYAGWFIRFELSISFTVSIYKQAWIIKKANRRVRSVKIFPNVFLL